MNEYIGENSNHQEMLDEYQNIHLTLKLSYDYKYYILMCALFNPTARNIVTYWDKHHQTFMKIVASEPENGTKHLFQAIILYFVRVYPNEMMPYAATFMKKLYDLDVFEDEFLI